MEVIQKITAIRRTTQQWRKQGLRIAFITTMGNLHAGHLKLIEIAKHHADRIVASIFVNPMQFAPNEDFGAYPRTLEEDKIKLAEAGTHLLFNPEYHEIYPQKLEEHTQVYVPSLSDILDGSERGPGYFQGITTIVLKLYNIVQPDIAVWGEKDFQQSLIIKQMVRDLSLPIEIIIAPTERDEDSLALSSRNGYLSASEHEKAPFLYQTLCAVKNKIVSGERDFEKLCTDAKQTLNQNGLSVGYFEICRSQDLKPATPDDTQITILASAQLGKTRLIDNVST